MEKKHWLMLNFTLPKEPSRVRVSVWRRLKKSGSVNIGQSMWLLPPSDVHMSVFADISADILQNSGEAYILGADFISTGNADSITSLFNKARDEEYREFLGKCEDFFREIDKETKKGKFDFAEIEENEDEYEKLEKWLNKITARDFFCAPLKEPSVEALRKCKAMFDDYCEKVYAQNDNNSF